MSAITLLCGKAPGFHDLSQEERDAIMHFALLWSLFEAAVLDTTHALDRSSRFRSGGNMRDG